MPELVVPNVRYHRSFVRAMAEEPGKVYLYQGLENELADAGRFADYVAMLIADAKPESPRDAGYVPATILWWVEGDEFLGRLGIRHELNEVLRTEGGQIGYWIRPSARGRGHGRACFRASLPVAASLGLNPVLLTCDEDNIASRRIIEGAGGVFESQFAHKRRYWVPTASL